MAGARTLMVSGASGVRGALFLKLLGDGSGMLIRKGFGHKGDATIALTAEELRLMASAMEATPV